MIILGDTPQDRGEQLETLTKRLLGSKGYVDCYVNVMASGSELDVQAAFVVPGLSGSVRHAVLCECKALQSPVDMTAWCKFLGKLFHHEKTTDDRYLGCFIALSGVNGYVQGHYDSLRTKTDKIQLLTGDSLTNEVVTFYKALGQKEVFALVNAATQRFVTQLEIGLYRERLFWIVVLSETEFTVVEGDGRLWQNDDTTRHLINLLHKALDGSIFVDLNEEGRVIQRRKNIASVLVSILIEHKGAKVELGNLPQVLDFTREELADAAWLLYEQNVIEFWKYNGKAQLPVRNRNRLPTISLEAWRVLLDGKINVQIENSSFADELINDEFLNDVSLLQANLPIPAERRPIWLNMLRLCRDAMRMLVHPIPSVLQHRNEPGRDSQQKIMDKMDLTTIERSMIDLLRYDYRKPAHGEFFQKKHDIHEMETTLSLKVKTSEKTLFECVVCERHALPQADESLGGGYIPILLVPNAPQPWESDAYIPKKK